MDPSIARLVGEHRAATEDALLHALTGALGAERAQAEAVELTRQLEAALDAGAVTPCVRALARRLESWEAEIGRAHV